MDIIILFAIILFSAIVHEVSHGLMAEKLGDDTAREEGRITLNPIVHIDPFGSILLPLIMYWSQASLGAAHPIVFGFAKPVPVNFNRLRNPKSGMALVSFAGPLSNFILAIVFALIIKVGLANAISGPILLEAIVINLVLGTFNLIPIPPLDGSKIVASLLPTNLMYRILSYERFGFVLVFVFLALNLLNPILIPVVNGFFRLFRLA